MILQVGPSRPLKHLLNISCLNLGIISKCLKIWQTSKQILKIPAPLVAIQN